MWLKKVIHKKGQFIILGIILFAISMIVTLAVDFTLELKLFSSTCINEENTPDVFAIGMGTKDKDVILDKDDLKNVKNVTEMEGKVVSVPIYKGKKDIKQFYQLMLFQKESEKNDYFILEDGNQENAPKSGEVWIAKTIAKPNHIAVGDKIKLGYDKPIELKVSGIYTSSLIATASLCVTPILVSDKDVSKFDEMDGALLALDLYDDDKEAIDDMLSDNDYCMTYYSRKTLQNKFTEVSDLLGVVGTLAAIIVFIIALFVIKFIVNNNIMRQFKEIGIYKCLGYKSKTIVSFYMIGYVIDGLIMTVLGTIAAVPIVRYMCDICTEYMNGFELTNASILCCVIVTVFMNLLLVANLCWSLRPIHKITPVEAFAIANTSSKKRLSESVIKNASASYQVAINDILKYKGKSVMVTLVFAICLLLSMLFAKIAYSSSIMTENPNLWFAVPKNNCYLFGNIDSDVVDWLDEQKKIAHYTYGDLGYSIPVKVDGKKVEDCQISFDVFSNPSAKSTKILVDGKFPKENEVVLTNNLMRILKYKVGDKLKLSVEENVKEYKICGTYDSMLSNYGIMITVEGMEQLKDDYVSSMAFIMLKNKKDFDGFKDQVDEKWSNITVDSEWFAMNNALGSVKLILQNISCILIFVFIFLSVMIVAILLLIENGNKRRQFGVMKAMGFPNAYIIRQNLFHYMILGMIGMILALAIHIAFSDKLLTVVLLNAFTDSSIILVSLLVGFMLLLMATVLIMCSRIRKIKPVELMEE